MGYGSIRCRSCGRTPYSTVLVMIGNRIYCRSCLRNIRVKKTGEQGEYLMHTGDRCFVSFMDKHGIDVQEFGINELVVGKSQERYI